MSLFCILFTLSGVGETDGCLQPLLCPACKIRSRLMWDAPCWWQPLDSAAPTQHSAWVLDHLHSLALGAGHSSCGPGTFVHLGVQAVLGVGYRQDPLSRPAAVTWQCTLALGQGGSFGGAMEMLAPQRERPWSWRDGTHQWSSLGLQKGR